jgi:hypothetical protein
MAPDANQDARSVEQGERLTFGGGTVVVTASAESTGGALAVIEEVPPLLDTPPRDEWSPRRDGC